MSIQQQSFVEAIKHYEAALKEAFPRGATGDVFEHWNKARIALIDAKEAIVKAEKQPKQSEDL